ncbi:hypothetical protein B0P06_004290 [Clostridium saccharoperbutylacetonicum]|uniref:Uncharacterized protein n=1 Tax=Clostridium saccharoperbutylacetonicum N1-4(HMT) TaxID=931276 RepID=M1MMG4_9CLOT|nr:hypothetical protein [Clostridium saccharoperbutylacetonicum]AGF57413.1 hypothetical protein Cspa_c36530 [Clostridium saccharoperbutylacetonicum N1-4(HMT)]NRT61823.1 hypothetical protein [Clostridium saccharoperbutylacetonicum]NSB25149.1 hypothetical protein [Clostridium saccharoperbutylacetonicum]NSB44519.1 hypothetical protein [Clostridium saccharoperbutylacetonicum]
MDKKKYESKTLIAEYKFLSKFEEFRFLETAYRLKDGAIIIEFDGASFSLYGLKLSYKKNIGRKGVYVINDEEYSFWKSLRGRDDNESYFVDWEKERDDQLEETLKAELNGQISLEHDEILERVSGDNLPY